MDGRRKETYTAVDPNSDGEIIAGLDAAGTDDVEGQAVLVDGAAEVGGVGAIADAHPAVLGGIPGRVELLGVRLGGGEAEVADGGLRVGDAEEVVLAVDGAVGADVGSHGQLGLGDDARAGGRRTGEGGQGGEGADEGGCHVRRHLLRGGLGMWCLAKIDPRGEGGGFGAMSF
jgi:hypothetical protein